MIPEINYWAVLVATVGTMIVGSVWYAPPVFGRRWARLAKVEITQENASWLPLVVGALMGFVTSWVLAGAVSIAWHFYDGSYFVSAVVTAIALWAGLTAARFITHDGFESRPSSLTVLNIAHELVTFLVIAVIIGVWPPAGTV